LITTDKQEVNRRVPFLSNIPIAGNLFKYQFEKQKRSELIIIMRPRIVRKSEDMDAIKRVEFARMNWCLADVTRLHGDIGYYNTMSRQPVTGGAPSFSPEPVDMSQLRDLPMPSNLSPTNTSPSSGLQPMPIQSSPIQTSSDLQPTPGYLTTAPTLAPQPMTSALPSFSTVMPDGAGR
jgi:general secretion pathway protein D